MITNKIKLESKYEDGFIGIVEDAINYLIANVEEYKKDDWGMVRVKPNKVAEAFDKIIMESKFELDNTTKYHKHGIGNNNRWDIKDADMVTIGYFNCNDDMFGGVYCYVEFKDAEIGNVHLK